jgi:hypothetical protein
VGVRDACALLAQARQLRDLTVRLAARDPGEDLALASGENVELLFLQEKGASGALDDELSPAAFPDEHLLRAGFEPLLALSGKACASPTRKELTQESPRRAGRTRSDAGRRIHLASFVTIAPAASAAEGTPRPCLSPEAECG